MFNNKAPRNATLAVGDGSIMDAQSSITQGYFRNVNFYPHAYDDVRDRYVETWVKTSDRSAKSPSLLGVVLNAQATQNSIEVHVFSHVDTGVPPIAALLPLSTGSQIADYINYITALRNAVDTGSLVAEKQK